jgi:serine/threonine-protein kinase RsbW
MNKVILTIGNELGHARLAALCAKEIASNVFDEIQQIAIETAVVEAVNNCIEHACAGYEDCEITATFQLMPDKLTIELIDNGIPFNPVHLEQLVAEFDYDSSDIDQLPEGGIGLKIIKNCMDNVYYQRTATHNYWLLTKYR